MNLPLALCFKGSRSYLHGTDMLNAIGAAVEGRLGGGGFRHLNFLINRMTSRNLCLELKQGGASSVSEAPVASLTFETAGIFWHGALVEEPGEPICRYPYDEESIVARCLVNQTERSVVFSGEPVVTPIETIVSVTKALHRALLPNAPGRWVFCRWESEQWPPSAGVSADFAVTLTQALGTRLTRSVVVSGGERVGWVYFSAKEEL